MKNLIFLIIALFLGQNAFANNDLQKSCVNSIMQRITIKFPSFSHIQANDMRDASFIEFLLNENQRLNGTIQANSITIEDKVIEREELDFDLQNVSLQKNGKLAKVCSCVGSYSPYSYASQNSYTPGIAIVGRGTSSEEVRMEP